MSKFWESQAKIIDRANFRGDGQYLEQKAEMPMHALYRDLVKRGHDGKFEFLKEDGAFGCKTKWLTGPNIIVSRDLIESIYEIAFIEESLGKMPEFILDIGAGYGRLAHRILSIFNQGIHITCTDSVPISREICRFYLEYRKVDYWAIVKPEDLIRPVFNLAINIHSWPECDPEEVEWWLEKLAEWKVKNLMVIPHNVGFWYQNAGKGEFRSTIEKYYKLKVEKTMPEVWPRTYTMWELK
jgi:hypothetical protein